MNKLWLALILFMCPMIVLADTGSSLDFTPPVSDISVVFLGNLFGIVDGILHGNGSQIMGTIFGVFNDAVLALGGIIMVYTLLVATMNTAQEGQMLGQKWSSIWIPIRTVAGLALLIPKASGYCLMQIFVMWVVVQGVGAADKVWDAALGYLNRGGAIVQAQINPTKALLGQTGGAEIALGAQAILAGQVCMIALEKQLHEKMKMNQTLQAKNAGPCGLGMSDAMKPFCNNPVESFVNSINLLKEQESNPSSVAPYTVSMPNFPATSPYAVLNGICGKIQWSNFTAQQAFNDPQLAQLASIARVTAIQQMYSDLLSLAQVIVGNDPNFMQLPQTQDAPFSSAAVQPYGLPQTPGGTPCAAAGTPNCILWGGVNGNTAPLLAGSELQNAIQDYNGIMLPTLTLIKEAAAGQSTVDQRAFIQKASTDGWINAGSYYFDLIKLNTTSNMYGDSVDSSTGLDGSLMDPSLLTAAFPRGTGQPCSSTSFLSLCTWLEKDITKIDPIVTLINGTGLSGVTSPLKAARPGSTITLVKDQGSSTVFGYTNNALILQLPNQPGQGGPQFSPIAIWLDLKPAQMPTLDFPCGEACFIMCFCLGRDLADIFFNTLVIPLYNGLQNMIFPVINLALNLFLVLPLLGMEKIFQQGMYALTQPNVNPIVALANMGTYYINFAQSLAMEMMIQGIVIFMMPLGSFIAVLMAMGMPLVVAWLGIMVAIGFSVAYYVPMLPYMMFFFGTLAWLITVIEAMVAAPIVALGVTHPEGHDAFGKGEAAIMILMNIFLRPSMMIIGYIAGIALSYVSVWLLNVGFTHAISYTQDSSLFSGTPYASNLPGMPSGAGMSGLSSSSAVDVGYASSSWTGFYVYFFAVIIYTTMYISVVSKSFSLIALLPDKVLRWIGGHPETAGSDAASMADDVKGAIKDTGEKTKGGQDAINKQFADAGASGFTGAKEKLDSMGGGKVQGNPTPDTPPSSSTPPPPPPPVPPVPPV